MCHVACFERHNGWSATAWRQFGQTFVKQTLAVELQDKAGRTNVI